MKERMTVEELCKHMALHKLDLVEYFQDVMTFDVQFALSNDDIIVLARDRLAEHSISKELERARNRLFGVRDILAVMSIAMREYGASLLPPPAPPETEKPKVTSRFQRRAMRQLQSIAQTTEPPCASPEPAQPLPEPAPWDPSDPWRTWKPSGY